MLFCCYFCLASRATIRQAVKLVRVRLTRTAKTLMRRSNLLVSWRNSAKTFLFVEFCCTIPHDISFNKWLSVGWIRRRFVYISDIRFNLTSFGRSSKPQIYCKLGRYSHLASPIIINNTVYATLWLRVYLWSPLCGPHQQYKVHDEFTLLINLLIPFSSHCLDKLRWYGPHHGARNIEFKFSGISCVIYNTS